MRHRRLDDAPFDVVLSCVGVMFAPHHQRSADELLRVCRPGGRIGLLSWTPSGFVGQMFATMRPYAAPPPPGAQPPPLWGDEAHVRQLFGDRVTDVEARVQSLGIDRFESPADFREFFKRAHGPTIAAYRYIAEDAQKVTDLDRDLEELGRRFGIGEGSDSRGWEYLLFTARRA